MSQTIITGLLGAVLGYIICLVQVLLSGGMSNKQFKVLNFKIDQMAKQQSEAAQELRDLRGQLSKANVEIQAKIQALIDAAANDTVSDELQTAIDDLKPAAQALDDIVPDAPPEEPIP